VLKEMIKKIHLIAAPLFYLAFFLYSLLVVNPVLIFHHQQLGFSFTNRFLQEFIQYPGGIAEYLSLFLFQFASGPFAGALLYTLLAFLLMTLTYTLVPRGFKKYGVILSFIPAVIVAGLMASYSFHLVFFISVVLILAFLNILDLLIKKQLRFAPFLILVLLLMAIAYYTTGGFYFMIFSLSVFLCLAGEKSVKTRTTAIVVLILCVLMPLISSKVLFYITTKDALLKTIPYYYSYKPGGFFYSLFFYIPLFLFVTRLLFTFPTIKVKLSGFVEEKSSLTVLQYATVFIAGILLCFFVFPATQKHKIQVDYYSYTGQWDKLLALVAANPSEDRLIQFHTNRALYHTGKLHEKMFDYPQTMGVDGLFLTRFLMPEILVPTTQLYIDMGYINEALHWGNEAISQNENSPQILEQLILANIIAMNYQPAQLYINNLKSNPIFRKKAIHYEQYIQGGNSPEIDSLVRTKRRIMPSADFVVKRSSPQLDLINLLNNKDNKMAYEYLQAYFLLKNDLASFVQYFPMGKKYQYPHVPVVFQEALVLYAFELRRRGKDLPKLKLDSDIIKKFNNYMSVIQFYNGDLQKAKSELERNFGNTYWFYVHYLSPVTTKKTIIVK
jgi:hypothetical protein